MMLRTERSLYIFSQFQTGLRRHMHIFDFKIGQGARKKVLPVKFSYPRNSNSDSNDRLVATVSFIQYSFVKNGQKSYE